MKKIFLLFIIIIAVKISYAQSNHIISVSNFKFDPKDLTIALGDTVTWQWVEGSHTTTSDSTTGQNVWNNPITVEFRTFSFVLKSEGLHRYYCIPHGSPGGVGMAGSVDVQSAVSVESEKISELNYELLQNYPNPFNPVTSIRLSIPVSGQIKIKVFNLLGEEIALLFSGRLEKGIHNFTFNAEDKMSGIYIYKVEAKGEDGSNFYQTRKMTLLK